MTTVAVLCAGCGSTRSAAREHQDDSAPPVRGGTLRVVYASDVDHLSTVSSYLTNTFALSLTFARQLVSYPPAGDYEGTVALAADLAREVPTRENGGISADGRVYLFHLRDGVLWNTTPPRAVTAHDFTRAFKLFCNPVSPVGTPAYYTRTIAGMVEQCAAFALVPSTIADIRRFVTSHDIAGARAVDDSTLQFTLLAPAADFLNLLAMPCASPVPDEYLDYLPDSPEFRQHTLSNGPYAITRYVQDRSYELGRNPVWDGQRDPNHPAYVDRISISLGADPALSQLMIEAGTADLSLDAMLTADRASLLALGDPRAALFPDDAHYSDLRLLHINHAGPGNGGALRRLGIRKALALAVDKDALVRLTGGRRVARPVRQAVFSSSSGFMVSGDQYVTPGDRGDPRAARRLLTEAGFPNGLRLRLVYRNTATGPSEAQSLQSSLRRAGFEVEVRPYALGDFYVMLGDPRKAERGEWDIAVTDWVPEWFGGNNGRSLLAGIYDGRTFGHGVNYGGYDNPLVDAAIDRALAAPSLERAEIAWQEAAREAMADVAAVPLIEERISQMLSSRVRHCVWSVLADGCNLTAIWLADGASTGKEGRR